MATTTPPRADDGATTLRLTGGAGMSARTDRPRVLVVDDEPINIRFLHAALRDQCEVRFATSGREALAAVAAEPPDLVLLDIRMPDLDGYLERLSRLDGLTAVPNRRAFDEHLDLEWRRAQRFGTPLSLIMLDIDHFKGYDDHYGHLAGDACLRRVARTLADHVSRAGDLLARYGGDEFACLLPGNDPTGVGALAERLRAGVEGLRIDHPDSPVAPWVTLSLGTATCSPSPGEEAVGLVARADERLYQAKQRGRNQVVGEPAERPSGATAG